MAKRLDAFSIITKSLEQYGGYQRIISDHIMVCCPFHSDNTPSCGIFIGEGTELPIGVFNCLGCGERGNWNKFAEKVGLPRIEKWSNYNTKIVYKDLDDEIPSIKALADSLRAQYTEWPDTMGWRGYSGKLIQDVGGLMINDNRLNTVMLLFPIEVHRKIRGGIKAYLEKPKFGLSYLSTKGGWVKKYGLFPYKYVRRMLRETEIQSLALVEGPRDALRLLKNGIPALAVLGAQNFGPEKALILSSLMVESVFAIPDTDEAGELFSHNVKKHMRRYCNTYSISLGNGDKKIDPDSASQKKIDKIKELILS